MHLVTLLAAGVLQHAVRCDTVAGLAVATMTTPPSHAVTQVSNGVGNGNGSNLLLKRDDIPSQLITCGYLNGSVNNPRTAQPGFDCRVDPENGIWGFCPSTVIAATDCGLAAACRDGGTCTSICRFNAGSGLTTITCPSSGKTTAFCSTAMLTFGVDQSYGYIACGPDPKTEHYIISPTFTPPTTATSTTPTKSPSTTTPTSSSSSMSSLTTKTSNSQRLNTSTLFAVSQTPAGVNSSTGQINQQQSGSGTNLGAIIGGVIGGLALLCLSVVTVVFIVKKNWWNKKAHSPPTTSAPFQPAPPYAPHAPHPPYASYEQRQPPQVYPSVFEAASSSNKFKPIKHTGYGGYAAYAVELP